MARRETLLYRAARDRERWAAIIAGAAVVTNALANSSLQSDQQLQCRRNEFESEGGGHTTFVVPLHFLAVQAQLVAMVSAFVA